MVRLALIFAAAAALGWSQIAIYSVDSAGRETAVDAVLDIGKTLAGDILDQRIRLRNSGSATVQLTALRLNGPAYSLEGHPTLPHVVAPGSNVDFRVRFQPPAFGVYSATLQANDRTIVLRATAEQGASLLVDSGGAWSPPSNAAPVDFGRVERGQIVARRFALRNDGIAVLAVARVEVSGLAFAMDQLAAFRLEPGELRAFEVRFAPTRAGIIDGSLSVESRVYRLQGVALEPPVPEARIAFPDSSPPTSGQQRQIQVRLAEPSRTNSTATLTVAFEPATGLGDDPAVQFLPGSARSVSLAISEGDSAARANGAASLMFQTGTTAGVLVFKLLAGARSYEERLTLAPAPPKIDSVKAARSAGAIEVTVTGFDNARSTATAAFTFFDRSGRAVADPIRVAVAAEFANHFRQSPLGGLFSLRAQFPVNGDASSITGVEVELGNSAGQSKSERAPF